MGRLLNIVTPLHKMTKRDYVGRMMDEKVHCMMKAKEYEQDYWDGDRRYGYGCGAARRAGCHCVNHRRARNGTGARLDR